MESYVNARLPLVDGPTIEGLMEVRLENHAMPAELLGQVSPLLVEAGDRARRKVLSLRHGSN